MLFSLRLPSFLLGTVVLLAGAAPLASAAQPGCLNPCIPEACPDTCLGCEAAGPTACTPSCDGGAVACHGPGPECGRDAVWASAGDAWAGGWR